MAGKDSFEEQHNDELQTELLGEVRSEDPTTKLSTEASDEEFVKAQLAEEAEEAIDSLYDEEAIHEEDERLTELLTPIKQTAHPVMPVVAGPSESVASTMHRNEGRIRHKVAAALISILAIFGIGLGFGMYTKHVKSEQETAAIIAETERKAQEAQEAQQRAEQEAEEARIQEAAHAPRNLKFIVSAVDYDLLATRIPLDITGIDLDGKEVQTEGFINVDGEGVALSPGEYTATIPASPIRADGGMYKTPSDTYSFRVPNDEQEVINVDQAIVLIPLNTAELTDDIINNAYNWAIKDTQYESVVEANVAAAKKIQEEEKERKAAEEKRKQNEEQRMPLAQSFVENLFTNVGFTDKDDDSKVKTVTNWNSVVGQYVASGSAAAGKLAVGSGTSYCFATSVQATGVSGDTITVSAEYVAGNEIKNGWTLNTGSKIVTCTFDEYNKITDYSIS